jgi:hypothetical protein
MMDGLSSINIEHRKPFPKAIETSELSAVELPPFYRQLSDRQVDLLAELVQAQGIPRDCLRAMGVLPAPGKCMEFFLAGVFANSR